jgi:hypothetical protein
MDTDVTFTQEYSKVSISTGNEKYSSPKLIHLGESADKGMVTKRREMTIGGQRGYLIRKLRISQVIKRLEYYLHLSWLGAAHSGYGKGWEGSRYVHHSYTAYRTSHSHMVEYRGRMGLSLPAGYHKQSVELGVFQGNLKSRHRAYTITTSLSAQAKQSLRAR